MNESPRYTPHEQTNPRAHSDAPYALRYAGGRPVGCFATVDEAVSFAKPGATVVTFDGWWIMGRVSGEATAHYPAAPAGTDALVARSDADALDALTRALGR